MKPKHLLLNIALLNECVPSLVESFYNTPADIERFNQRVENEENFGYRFIQLDVPSYVSNPSQEWIQGYIDPFVRLALGEDLEGEIDETIFRVVVLNDPRQGFTVGVIPATAVSFKVVANFGDHGTYQHFQDALFAAQELRKEEGVTFIDIDVFDADGDENGTYSYWDEDPGSVHMKD